MARKENKKTNASRKPVALRDLAVKKEAKGGVLLFVGGIGGGAQVFTGSGPAMARDNPDA